MHAGVAQGLIQAPAEEESQMATKHTEKDKTKEGDDE
jgi:hypothetical protein